MEKNETVRCLENEGNHGNGNTEERADTNKAGSAITVATRARVTSVRLPIGTWGTVGSGWVGLLGLADVGIPLDNLVITVGVEVGAVEFLGSLKVETTSDVLKTWERSTERGLGNDSCDNVRSSIGIHTS